jgi:molecular chaperone GrpE
MGNPTEPPSHAKPRRIEISTPDDPPAGADAQERPIAPEAAAEAEVPASDDATAEQEMAKLQEMLVELEQKCAFAEDQQLRVVAELQNYKRRVAQEREQLVRHAAEGLVGQLIPVLDNFERAMEVQVSSADGECLLTGVRMIYDQLLGVLADHGATPIEALGAEFDPHVHEAVEKEESAALPPGIVVRERLKGYTLHGRLLRPAKVRVTVRPAGA